MFAVEQMMMGVCKYDKNVDKSPFSHDKSIHKEVTSPPKIIDRELE